MLGSYSVRVWVNYGAVLGALPKKIICALAGKRKVAFIQSAHTLLVSYPGAFAYFIAGVTACDSG
jgi:hypothetical protein